MKPCAAALTLYKLTMSLGFTCSVAVNMLQTGGVAKDIYFPTVLESAKMSPVRFPLRPLFFRRLLLLPPQVILLLCSHLGAPLFTCNSSSWGTHTDCNTHPGV